MKGINAKSVVVSDVPTLKNRKKSGRQMTVGLPFVITCLVKTDLQVFWSCKIKFLANAP